MLTHDQKVAVAKIMISGILAEWCAEQVRNMSEESVKEDLPRK